MIIRKYSGSAWEEQYPKTTQDMIYDSGSTSTSIFDGNKKLKVDYLPDAVFDSLYFRAAISAGASNTVLADYFQGAVEHAVNNRNGNLTNGAISVPLGLEGYYFVISTAGTISQLVSPSSQQASTSGASFNSFYFRWNFSHGDSDANTSTTSSGALEVGDWIIAQTVTGTGTSGDPITITFGVVSNTYETMVGANGSVAGAKGLVPSPGATDNVKFLRGDGTFATPTDTNTVTSVGISGSETTGTVTFAASGAASIAQNGSTVTISATDTNTTYSAGTGLDLNTTTFALNLSELSATTGAINKLQDHMVFLDNGAQKKILFANVSNAIFDNGAGYTTNTGTVTSVATGHGLGGGTITTSGTITLDYPVYYADTQAGLPTSGVSANAIGFEY